MVNKDYRALATATVYLDEDLQKWNDGNRPHRQILFG